MITVNGRTLASVEGMTIDQVILLHYPYAKIFVKYNGRHVEPEEYPQLVLKFGDQLQVIHLMAGG